MDIHKQCDQDLLCRACLQVLGVDTFSSKGHDIFLTPSLAKKLVVCTSLSVEPQDGFPKYLCDCCFSKVNDFHTFQAMCADSAQRFRELLHLQNSFVLARDLVLEDEKPIFDLDSDDKVEITIAESNVLLKSRPENQENSQEVLIKPVNCGKRRSRRSKLRKAAELPETSTIPANNIRKKSVRRTRNAVAKYGVEINLIKEKEQSEIFTEFIDSWNERDYSDEEFLAEEEEPAISENDFTLSEHKIKRTKKNNRGPKSDILTGGNRRRCRRNKYQPNEKCKNSNSKFQCDLCPMRFFVEHRLVAHKRSHEGLVPYPCPREDCDKAFNRWHCLSEHLKQHEGTNRLYTCEEEGCDKVYKHKPTLVMHMRKYHKRGPELKSHVCEICGKVFKASAILNDHRYTHKDKSELPFACNEVNCQRRFSNKEKLKVHLMRHAGIKNFICPYCGMRKTTRNELKIHINYHTLERTWPCRFCPHVCNSAGNLKMHVRTVHERAKDYACRFCNRRFAKPDTRKYHEMTHTGEKPNECQECGKRFTQPAALRTHKKIHQRQRLNAMTQPSIDSRGKRSTGTQAAPIFVPEVQNRNTALGELCDMQPSVALLHQGVLPMSTVCSDEANVHHMLHTAHSI